VDDMQQPCPLAPTSPPPLNPGLLFNTGVMAAAMFVGLSTMQWWLISALAAALGVPLSWWSYYRSITRAAQARAGRARGRDRGESRGPARGPWLARAPRARAAGGARLRRAMSAPADRRRGLPLLPRVLGHPAQRGVVRLDDAGPQRAGGVLGR
jgi:hypothetical protein